MAGPLLLLLVAALAVQMVAADDRICFAVSVTEYCVCPSSCACLPVVDQGVCSDNQCDCAEPTAMKSVKGTINSWPAGGWGGVEWGSVPGSDWWYPGKNGHYWPGISPDGTTDGKSGLEAPAPSQDGSQSGNGDGDPPYNPNLKDPTQPGSTGSGDKSNESNTPSSPGLSPPPPSPAQAANTAGANQGPGNHQSFSTDNNSGATHTRTWSQQSLGLTLVCLLATLGAFFSS